MRTEFQLQVRVILAWWSEVTRPPLVETTTRPLVSKKVQRLESSPRTNSTLDLKFTPSAPSGKINFTSSSSMMNPSQRSGTAGTYNKQVLCQKKAKFFILKKLMIFFNKKSIVSSTGANYKTHRQQPSLKNFESKISRKQVQ